MDHPKPWLRYVKASEIQDATLELEGLLVRTETGEELGSVNGLVVDATTGRPRYVVVSAGGWFTSKRFLVPIGEVHVATNRQALTVALSKEQVKRFPGFDTDEFENLTVDEVTRLNRILFEVFEPGLPWPADATSAEIWERKSYRAPEWWGRESAPNSGQHSDSRQVH